MKRAREYKPRKSKEMKKNYPKPRRDEEVIENHFGVKVSDPYRWMENPDSQETKEWVEQQNKLSDEYITSYPRYKQIKQRLTKIYNFDKYSAPFKDHGKYYFFKKEGMQNQAVMYEQDLLHSEPRVFFNPNTLSKDGTTALGDNEFSHHGKYWAYGLHENGSDWMTIYVKDVKTGQNLPDKVSWAKFTTITWTHDESGFFYSRYLVDLDQTKAGQETDSNLNHLIYYHRVGTSQGSDVLVYHDPLSPNYYHSCWVSDDGKYLFVVPSNGCSEEHRLLYSEIYEVGDFYFKELVSDELAKWDYITNEGAKFYFMTNRGAPNNKIVSLDLNNFDGTNYCTIVPESPHKVLESVTCTNHDCMVLTYMVDVSDRLYLHKLSTGELIREVTLPGLGSVNVTCHKDDDEMFYTFTSFLHPSLIYRYSFKTHESTLFRETSVPTFNPNKYNANQVFYKSKDGTEIPMFVISKKDLELNGQNPVYLYGYGGFGVSLTPHFSTMQAALLEFGFTVCIANLRGGGEYGKKWHDMGKLNNKQNVFDDFISAAEYLITNKFTSPEKLCINGASNGGLLVGACINQRPELFGCAIAEVGVMDMLRFHLHTCGHGWTTDYGNPSVEEDFKVLYKYSPLHNINQHEYYPATLLTTADHDDRVVPLHSYKYMATLQHEVGNKFYQLNPLMIKVETNTGHGAGKGTKKIIEEYANKYSFMMKSLKF